ncbi:MAG: cytochrome c oxidase assembly protein, partial [Verrucomicrobiota bacterium]
MPVPLHWHTEPLLIGLLVGFGWLYALLIWPLRGKLTANCLVKLQQPICFYAGLITVYLAVGSPLDQLGEDFFFSAHMVQHMLLIYLAPPLILFGLPGWLVDVLLKHDKACKIWRLLTHPVFAGLLFTFLYTVWHIPVAYELALREKWAHVLEHWMMFVPALLMWWPIL